jgi:hypothetical protein
MAGAVKHVKLESRTARGRLKRGRQPHWQALVPGKVHLGPASRRHCEVSGAWLNAASLLDETDVPRLSATNETTI